MKSFLFMFSFNISENTKFKKFFLHLHSLHYRLFCSAKLCVGYVTRHCSVRSIQRQRCIPCAKNYKNILKKSKRPTPLQKLSRSGQSLRTRYKNTFRKKCETSQEGRLSKHPLLNILNIKHL